ncbi:MAG TPA: hypothetical protein VH419_17125, partial [Nocardioidaceae bacterium]
MSEQRGGADNERYDRDLLLYGSKRDQVLDLWEVKRYGSDTFGDPDAISVYGMTPDDWFARGIRLLGRTVVECTRDVLAREIAADVATVAQTSSSVPLVLDPFVGSANTLYWIQQRLPTSPAIGVDLDGAICELTKRNLDVVQSRIDLLNLDYAAGLDRVAVQTSQPIVVYVAPPWGHALDPEVGLDLSRSEPPVAHVV